MFSWPALTLAAHLQKSEWFRENYRGPYAKISPGCSLEGLMLKLKLQYFGHLMQRVDWLEKTLMLGGIGSRRRRGWQRMRWLDDITYGHEFEWTPGVGDGQGGLACCDSWGHKESNMTEWLHWTELMAELWQTQQFVPANLWRDLSLKYIFPRLIKWYKYWQPPYTKYSATCCTIKTKRSKDCHSSPSSSWYFGGCKFWQQSQMLNIKMLCME